MCDARKVIDLFFLSFTTVRIVSLFGGLKQWLRARHRGREKETICVSVRKSNYYLFFPFADSFKIEQIGQSLHILNIFIEVIF